MKIIIPVDNNNGETEACLSFGRAPYFMLYDTETKGTKFIENEAAQQQGGAGIRAAQTITDHNPDALLTPRCGDNAADVIRTAGIPMYRSLPGKAMDSVTAYLDEKLELLAETHAGLHQHRGN